MDEKNQSFSYKLNYLLFPDFFMMIFLFSHRYFYIFVYLISFLFIFQKYHNVYDILHSRYIKIGFEGEQAKYRKTLR